jgi:hypothetical protein
MTRIAICGHVGVEADHGRNWFLGARFRVALKIANVDATRARTTKLHICQDLSCAKGRKRGTNLHAQLILRRTTFANRTFNLTAYEIC